MDVDRVKKKVTFEEGSKETDEYLLKYPDRLIDKLLIKKIKRTGETPTSSLRRDINSAKDVLHEINRDDLLSYGERMTLIMEKIISDLNSNKKVLRFAHSVNIDPSKDVKDICAAPNGSDHKECNRIKSTRACNRKTGCKWIGRTSNKGHIEKILHHLRGAISEVYTENRSEEDLIATIRSNADDKKRPWWDPRGWSVDQGWMSGYGGGGDPRETTNRGQKNVT